MASLFKETHVRHMSGIASRLYINIWMRNTGISWITRPFCENARNSKPCGNRARRCPPLSQTLRSVSSSVRGHCCQRGACNPGERHLSVPRQCRAKSLNLARIVSRALRPPAIPPLTFIAGETAATRVCRHERSLSRK